MLNLDKMMDTDDGKQELKEIYDQIESSPSEETPGKKS